MRLVQFGTNTRRSQRSIQAILRRNHCGSGADRLSLPSLDFLSRSESGLKGASILASTSVLQSASQVIRKAAVQKCMEVYVTLLRTD